MPLASMVIISARIARDTDILGDISTLQYGAADIVLTRDVISVIARMQERITVESYHFVCNPIFTKVVTDELGHQKYDLHRRKATWVLWTLISKVY